MPGSQAELLHLYPLLQEFMKKVEEKRLDVNSAVGMGEVILAICHPDCITTIKHWITIIRARFEEVSHRGLCSASQHLQSAGMELRDIIIL